VIVRTLMPLAAVAGCCLVAGPAGAQPPARPAPAASKPTPAMTNQQLANAVKAALENSGQLRGRPVGVLCRDGKVELTGTVASDAQRQAIWQTVARVPGVQTVNDALTVSGPEPGVVPAQALSGPPASLPALPTSTPTAPRPTPMGPMGPMGPMAPTAPMPMSPSNPVPGGAPAMGTPFPGGPVMGGSVPSGPVMGGPVMGGPVTGGPVAGGPVVGGAIPGMPGTDPMPMAHGPVPTPYDMNPPRLPTHAWPTYAPYNNFGRVAYPEAYPYNAWPFIGPFYPFPKVPPGWRKVALEWDDGHWYYGRAGTGYDRWRIRFW
jgi:hypothetical protein